MAGTEWAIQTDKQPDLLTGKQPDLLSDKHPDLKI